MITISELNYLNDLSEESDLDISTIVGGYRRRVSFVNQRTGAFASANTFGGNATAIANAEGTFSSPRRRSRRGR